MDEMVCMLCGKLQKLGSKLNYYLKWCHEAYTCWNGQTCVLLLDVLMKKNANTEQQEITFHMGVAVLQYFTVSNLLNLLYHNK